ncbi:hypothetical protein GIV19_19735 [Pseudomonas syringae]|uniref:hypothetical protein n=1 Tax=Pseudomonas syringae TaxID=317 RepID=UPI001F1DC787|nr:hypothetical protein [Pseudomonas syringae]MCF5709496.1 hypothetical protein [Pseudomonas syringae]
MSTVPNFIKRLPTKGSSAFATVRVVQMTHRLLKTWHEKVQVLIDANYSTHPGPPGAFVRADVGWNWNEHVRNALLHDALFLGQKNRGSIKLCLVAVPDSDNPTLDDCYPIGMLILVPKLECNAGVKADRAFTWYLSNAPREFYAKYFSGARIEGVAKMLLDCVVQHGYAADGDGSMLLRAATEGGKHLKRFYGDCRLRSLHHDNGPITYLRRTKQTEYFLLNKSEARMFTRAADRMR